MKPTTSNPVGKFVALTCHIPSPHQLREVLLRKNSLVTEFSLRKERKNQNVWPICRLSEGLPEELDFVLPESKC